MLKGTIAAACLCAMTAQGHASTLSGQQIHDLVAGATVEIDTPLGTKLPVRYTRDGRLSAEAGGLAPYLGTASDKGRWWVESDQLCHKWFRWFGSEPQCMRLSRAGRAIHWRSRDGYSGTAAISVPPAVETAAAPALARAPAPVPARVPVRAPAPAPAEHDSQRQAVPPETPSMPAGAAEAPPAASAEAAGPPSQDPANESAVQAAPAKDPPARSPPAPIPATAPAPVPAAAAPQERAPPQPQAEPRRAALPMFRVVNVRSDDVLNVRSGPSADFDIVGGLPPGSSGIAITSACRAVWCPVQHRATSGWVNAAYLAPEQPSYPRGHRPALRVDRHGPRWLSWRHSARDFPDSQQSANRAN